MRTNRVEIQSTAVAMALMMSQTTVFEQFGAAKNAGGEEVVLLKKRFAAGPNVDSVVLLFPATGQRAPVSVTFFDNYPDAERDFGKLMDQLNAEEVERPIGSEFSEYEEAMPARQGAVTW